MGEAIGFAASLATLTKVVRTTVHIARQLPNAFDEVKQLKRGLSQVDNQLQLLQRLPIERLCCSDILLSKDRQRISANVKHIEADIGHIAGKLTDLTSGHGWQLRLKWVLKNSSTAQQLMRTLVRIETSLDLTLNILLCHSRIHDRDILERIYLEVSLLAKHDDLPVDGLYTLAQQSISTRNDNTTVLQYRDPNTTSWSYSSGTVPFGHGVGVILTTKKSKLHTTYAISTQLGLLFSRTLVLHLSLRTYWHSRINFSILRGSHISIVNWVPEDCDFMTASKRGDTLGMHHLLAKGMAGPNDVTIGNITPICFAIESGNVDAVELLLKSGADANGLFGQIQTSPLAWAVGCRQPEITRLLLSYGAACDHVTTWGWSPLFYLWQETEQVMPNAVEYITMLAARGDFTLSHDNIFDIAGYGAIHRAVIFGTPAEVDALLRVDVDASAIVGLDETPLQWNAIHTAVCYGRLDNFEVLLSHNKHFGIHDPDPRGWTLLHIATSAGRTELARRLLELGADWKTKSKPSYSHMSEDLYGGCWTPADVAKAHSDDRWLDYLQVLKEVKGKEALSTLELAALQDDWYDTAEYI